MSELDRLREELQHAKEANKAAGASFDAAIQDESLTMPSVRKATLALRADDIFQAEQRLVAAQAAFDDAAIRALFDRVKYDPCEPVVSDGVEALRGLMNRAAMLLSGFANMHTELTGNGTIERLNAALKEIDE